MIDKFNSTRKEMRRRRFKERHEKEMRKYNNEKPEKEKRDNCR